jgi:hypothetical protein
VSGAFPMGPAAALDQFWDTGACRDLSDLSDSGLSSERHKGAKRGATAANEVR